jgi:hypothetical protein
MTKKVLNLLSSFLREAPNQASLSFLMRLAENESRRVGMKFKALVVMRLKLQKQIT